jgi:uncharacterized MAPEG superfamily protein
MPNYSLYTIPLSYILASIPHIFAFRLYITTTSKPFPSKAPRTFIAKVESDPALPASTRSQILGGEWAHANSMENIGLFAAAVVAANSAGVENWWLNVLSGGYCVARFVYNHGELCCGCLIFISVIRY